jgi:hypothetical protein
MSLDNFIPAVWSARLLSNLNNAHVYANLCNRDYEGEIGGMGDTVKINSIGNPTIGDYTKDTNMSAVETLTDAQTTLVIDKAKYFNFQVDDIDQAQTKPKVMSEAMRNAAWGLADAVDTGLAALYSEVPAANYASSSTNAAPVACGALTAGSSFYDRLVDLSVILDDNNTPRDGRRWVVVPNWAIGIMAKDARFVNATDQGNSLIANGIVARAAGFNIYASNNISKAGVTSTSSYRVMAGHPMAWSYAESVAEVDAYRPELRFADAVKGLLVYGYKVVRPANLAVLFAKFATS